MSHDWSPRTFRIGIAASLAILLLQWGGVPVLEAINPLSVTGCANPQMLYIRAPTGSHVSADVDETPVKLVNKRGDVEIIPAAYDHPIMLLDQSDKRHGPFLLQGIDHHRQTLCGWTKSGTTECIPLGEVRGIYVINQGNFQRERRKGLVGGAIAGGVVGLGIPLTVAVASDQPDEVPIALCTSLLTVPVFASIGAGVGSGVGTLVGNNLDATDVYFIDPAKWQFQKPLSAAPPSE